MISMRVGTFRAEHYSETSVSFKIPSHVVLKWNNLKIGSNWTIVLALFILHAE